MKLNRLLWFTLAVVSITILPWFAFELGNAYVDIVRERYYQTDKFGIGFLAFVVFFQWLFIVMSPLALAVFSFIRFNGSNHVN